MKKFFALLMALVMVFSLSTVAFAATVNTVKTGDDTQNVNVNVTPTAAASTLYHVLISWDSLQFEFTASSSEWDVKSHTYKFSDGTWKDNYTCATITLENHSNAAIQYTPSYEAAATADSGVTVAVSGENNAVVLETADNDLYRGEGASDSELDNTYKAGPTEKFTVSVSGAPKDTANGLVTMGAVKITISPVT